MFVNARDLFYGTFNSQNICDGILLGLHIIHKNPAFVAQAILFSVAAIYTTKPETVLGYGCAVLLSTAAAGATTGLAHQLGKRRFESQPNNEIENYEIVFPKDNNVFKELRKRLEEENSSETGTVSTHQD